MNPWRIITQPQPRAGSTFVALPSAVPWGLALLAAIFSLIGPAPARAEPAPTTIDFNGDVRPILSRHCFACHGPDAEHREAELRLDSRHDALQPAASGAAAIVPGQPTASELITRITSTDDALRMPPAEHGPPLSAQQQQILRTWITEGAGYDLHWSFAPPVRPDLPRVKRRDWPRTPLDDFILARLEALDLPPNPAADRYTLIRRLSLDLRGLPPSPAEVAAFVADNSPSAYETLVDRYLADPAYGERWARVWLDQARYADSAGYGSDPLRTIWRYRDWVIASLNANQPFDEFTRDQLAGDLLPGATLDQQIATAFHRNTMTNTEGGTDDEEFRVAAVKDRIDTTLQVWMGLTFGCAQCHNHKYDPISQREYYQLFAFFNQTADRDQPNESPTLPAPTAQFAHELARFESELNELKAQETSSLPLLANEQQRWEQTLTQTPSSATATGRYVRVELPGKQQLLSLAEVEVFTADGKNIATAGKASQSSTAYEGAAPRAIDGVTSGEYFAANSTTHTATENDPWWEVDLGRELAIERLVIWNRTDGGLHVRLKNFRLIVLDAGRKEVFQTQIAAPPNPSVAVTPAGAASGVPPKVLAAVSKPAGQRTPAESKQIDDYYRSISPRLKKLRDQIAAFEKKRPQPPTVPVMVELPADQHRATHIMVAGNFLNLGEAVSPGVPAAFHPLPTHATSNTQEQKPTRLDVARWLTDRQNPLTARVAVNRLWSQIFGVGLVLTEEDFGTQGELPSHPALLDYLAVEYMESGWNTKRLLREIVLSATYQQTAHVSEAHRQLDPQNRWLARAPRYRLEGELVRDQALALAGLLSRRQGGPSVFPPQPEGLWRAAFNGRDRTWTTSTGADRYRRGLYTFWRRTTPYPAMSTFDAPSREICNVRRLRTNTPLQALVTMNDPVFVEAAQALARRIVEEGGAELDDRLRFAWQLCLVRPPESQAIQSLERLYRSELAHFQADADAANAMATDPLGPLPQGYHAAELAAWTVVASVLLNHDGVLSRN